MPRASRSALRSTTARVKAARRRRSPAAEPRWTRPAWQLYHAGFERLEDRTMLSGLSGTDLKTYFQNLLNSESASFTQTETISNASLGGFLQVPSITLTENATLSGGVWSGTIGLSAPSATLFPGHTFSASVTSTQASQPALTGTYTIGSTTGSDFSLSVPSTADLVMNVGEALQISASGVDLSYNSSGSDTQTLATVQTAAVTSPQFTSMPSATLSNFALREDGFSFDGFTLDSSATSAPGIGDFLTTTGVALTASNFNVSFGTPANPTPSLSGSVGLTVSGLQLFPSGNLVQFQSTGVTAAYDFGNFDGTDPTGQLSLTISGFQLDMGQALRLSSSSDVVITPDQPTLATIGSVTLSSPLLTGLGTFTASNLAIQQDGFSLGSLNWTSPGAVTIGSGLLSFGSVKVDVNDFALQYGAKPAVAGTISFTATDASLYPGTSLLNVQLGSLTGSFDFSNPTSPGLMQVQIADLNIALGEALTVQLGSVDLTPGQSTILTASNVTVAPNLFTGLPTFTLPTFTLTQTGFSLGSFTIPVATGAVSIGKFASLSGVSIAVDNFSVDTKTSPVVSGSITPTIGGMTLFPGNTAVTSTLTNIQGTYDFGSTTSPGQFSMTVGSLSLSLFGQITLAASNVAITPDQSTIATIGSASLTFAPLDNLNMTLSDLAIQQTGFLVDTASVNLPSDLSLGNLLTLTTPIVTLTKLAYTFGGGLSGTVGFSTTGASLQLGTALDASIGQSSGSYDLATKSLSMNLGSFGLNLGGFADVTASSIALTYSPASDGSSTMTLGATGVEAFLGTGTGASRVGVDLTGGTLGLAVFDSTTGAITYAIHATGSVSLLGLPANSLSVTSGQVDFLDDTAGALSTTVTAGTTSIPLDFAGNEREVVARGLSLSVGGFASITGDFGFQEFTPTNGDTYLAIGAANVTASVSAGAVTVAVNGAGLGLLIDTTSTTPTYALVAGGGTDSLTGVPGLTLTRSGLAVRVRNGLDPSTVTLPSGGVITPDGTSNLDFSNLGSGTSDVTDVEGHVSLAIASFATITGDFGFQRFTDGTATDLAIGATNLSVVLGTSTTNLTLAGGSFGMVVAPGVGYALQAKTTSASLNGVPDLTLNTGNVDVLVRKGLDVSGDASIPTSVQTPGGAVTLDFSGLGTGTTDLASAQGHLTLNVTGLGSLEGDFGFQSYVGPSGAQQIAVGATNLTAKVGSQSTYVELSGASVGLVIAPGTASQPTGFALQETGGTVSLQGVTGLTLSAGDLSVKARVGLDLSAATSLPAVHTSGGDVALDFSGLGSGTGNLFAVQGVATLAVSNFVSVTGAFGLQVSTTTTDTYLAAGLVGNVTLAAGSSVSLNLTNLTIGALIDDNTATGATTYALQANEGKGSVTTLTLPGSPPPLSLSASDLSVLVDKGLDLSNLPSGVPTSVSVPVMTTETFAPDWSKVHSVTLHHAASVSTLTLTATPSGGTATPLIAGTDYTLSTDASGNTVVTFLNVPAANTTVAATYDYVSQSVAATETFTPDWSSVTSVTLQHAANPGTLTLTATPSGGTATSLVLGADYTLSTDANGNTVITFLKVPTAGTSVAASYSYTAPAATVSVNPGDIPAGTTSVTEIQGTVALSVANFASLQGNFAFQEQQPSTTGASPILAIGATDVSAVVGTADTNLTITGASLGMVIQDGNFALKSDGGTVALNGVPDLAISASGLQVQIGRGLSSSAIDAVPSNMVGNEKLSSLAGLNITQVQGSATISVANFVSLAGTFGFTETTTPDTGGVGTTTTILVGASDVTATIGEENASGTLVAGVKIAGASLGLEILRDSQATGSTYALQTSAQSLSLVGLPSDFSVTAGNVSVSINKTGAAVNQAIPGGQTITFANGDNIESFQGNLTIDIAGFALNGDFSFTKVVDATTHATNLLIGATGVNSPSISAGSQGSFKISDGTLGLVFFSDASGASQGYALTASATATATSGSSSGSLTLTIRRNTTTNPVNETVVVGTTSIPVDFTSSEVETNGTAYQSVVVSNANLNIDNSVIISASKGSTSTPVTGASSTNLTGVTLTLQDPSSPNQVLFTISADSAVYTTFSASATYDNRNWASGDKDLLLTNVSFTIGGFVRLSADSLDLRHYTINGAVTDSFIFANASLALLNNGSPMVTLTGSPVFHYTTGSSDPSQNGFILDSFTSPEFKFLDPSATLGPLSLTNPSVELSDFSFKPDFANLSATLSATVTISADATIGNYVKFVGTKTGNTYVPSLSGNFNLNVGLSLNNLTKPQISADDFNIKATNAEIDLGSYLKLTGTNIAIDPTAAANQDLISFSSLTATLTIPGTSAQVSGSATNFAIEGNGSFLAGSGFGVSFSLGQSDAANLPWPSWLPLQSATVSLSWANFNADPTNFLIDVSASINTTIAGMSLQGTVKDAVFDPSLVASGQSPFISVGTIGVEVSGTLFGGTVSGTLIAGVVTFDSTGAIVDGLDNLVGTTTPGKGPFTHVFYGGIDASFSMAGLAGFNIRVGLSAFGLLQVYVEADTPIPVGDTGLFLSDFRGGITFDTSFPNVISANGPVVSDALKLKGPAFSTPSSLTTAQWQAQLEQGVANQYIANGNNSITFSPPTNSTFIVQAGMTLYDTNPDVFALSGDVFFDTSGKFLVIGTATVADSLSVGAKAYVDLSTLKTTGKLNILYLTDVPAQPNAENISPIIEIYGFLTFSDTNGIFQMQIGGEADLNLPGGLNAEVTATVTLTFTASSFNVTLSGGSLYIPTLQPGVPSRDVYSKSPLPTALATADGSVTVENNNGTFEMWGGFLLTTNLSALNSVGIYADGNPQVYLKLNTTDATQTVNLSNGTLSLPPESFSLLVNGTADFKIAGQQVFALYGTLAMSISPTSLTIFVQASLLLGPDSKNPILTYAANGLIDVQLVKQTTPQGTINPGLAAKMTLTEGVNVPKGITFGENWLMVLNTTESTITYTIPQPVATNPPSAPVPTVMGPDYSSSNPLALTSYETITSTGARTLVIPDGAPPTGLPNYSNWTPASANAYFLILGRGTITVANSFTLSGNINVDASVSGSSVSFTLDVNANMAVNLNGNTVFSFAVAGGIQISNAGVAAVLQLNVSAGVPSSLGFSLNASFQFETNTTGSDVSLDNIDLKAGKTLIAASGDLKLLGGVVDLNGTFNFTVTGSSLTVAITSNVTILGATFTADGFAGVYYDAHPGLALDISLALPGGAQGIAPIAALGSNFVISGAFSLELNTCSVSRVDPNTKASIDPGFQVAVSNLGVYIFGFDATGSISIGITDAGFTFSVNLSLSIFNIVTVGLTGYYDGPSDFSFTGTAGFQFGDHTFGIGGSLSITISSSGFAASVSGWAAAFGLQISATGGIAITGTSVDIEVGFSVTIVPAINIDTPDVNFGLFTVPGIHIHTPAVVVTEYADFHLGTISAPPTVAPASPPPPTPPPIAGEITDANHNNANALELFIGPDASKRINGNNQVTGPQPAENYTLTLASDQSQSTNGETIIVSALGLQQTFTNVQEILVNNTQTGNDTITIANGIAEPVYMTLGSGNNTIDTGGGPATVTVTGDGNNQITSGNDSTITISGNGANQVTAGDGSVINVDGNGNNTISLNGQGSDASSVTIAGTGANHVTDTGGSPTITVDAAASGSNRILLNTGYASTLDILGNGSNSISALGSGPATVTVDGSGNNQITTGGTAGRAASYVYLDGSGNNQVSTGAGPADVYDRGTGGNAVSGGPGGGIDYYGVDAGGAAYASKGFSSLSTSYGNFTADVSGYSTYQLGDHELVAGNASGAAYGFGLSGVRSVILRAATGLSANAFTLSGWSGNARLYGAGVQNTLTFVPGPGVPGVNEVLSDSTLQVSGGVAQTIELSDIQTANLVGSAGGSNRFDLSSWTGNGSLTGPPGTFNTLVATDDAAVSTLSDTLFQRTGYGDMALSGIQAAILTGGPGANTFNVNGWSGSATLDGKDGSDTYNITLSGSGTGTINVADSGATGTDTLNVTAQRTTFVTATSVTVGTQSVNYGTSGIEVLNVLGGSSGLTFDVQSTSSNVSVTTVQTGGGANTINVSSTAGLRPYTAGVVDTMQGALAVIGNGQDTLNVDDTGSTVAKTDGTLTSTSLTGMGLGKGITFSGLGTLNIDLGSGGTTGNTFSINVGSGMNLPARTSIIGGSAVMDSLIAKWAGDFNGSLNLSRFNSSAIAVSGDFNGTLNDINPGTTSSVSIGGSLTRGSVLNVSSASDPAHPTSTMGLLGNIGTMTVGGGIAGTVLVSGDLNSLTVGQADTATTGGVNDVSGKVQVGGQLGTVSISGDVSGTIQESLAVSSLYIGGSVDLRGVVLAVNSISHSLGDINTMVVGQAVAGLVQATGNIGALTVGSPSYPGSVSGMVWAGSDIGTMQVYGNVLGTVQAGAAIHSLTIGSPAFAGSVTSTGTVSAGTDITSMTVYGDVAGKITAGGNIGTLTVGSSSYNGSVSGQVSAGSDIGTMQVYGDVSGTIQAGASIGSLTIGSSSNPGSVTSTGKVSAVSDITTMSVYGDVAGRVSAGGNIGTLTVGSTSYAGSVSGSVSAGIQLQDMSVYGSVTGTGLVSAGTDIDLMQVHGDVAGTVQAGAAIGQLTIGTSTYPGSVTRTGTVSAVTEITTMTVYGDVAGQVTAGGDIGTLTVGSSSYNGSVSGLVSAGSNIGTMQVYGDVSGTVRAGATIHSLTIGSPTYLGSVTSTGLVSAGQDIVTLLVSGNNAGVVQAGATLHSVTIGGSVIPNPGASTSGMITEGIIRAANIQGLTVGGDMAGLVSASADLNTMSVGQDMSGLIDVGGALGQLTVAGGTPGSIIAATVGTVATSGGYGPVVAQIQEGGIQRLVEAAVPSVPYPQPMALYTYPTSASADASPAQVNFQYFYEGLGSNNGTLANPQLTLRVTNNGSTAPDQYDLSLMTYNDQAKFNLARLDASGVSGIRNVAVEGDILTSVTAGASAFFGSDSSPAGIYLPQDNLAGVGVRDFVPNQSITAQSIQAVAFGSYAEENGLVSTGAQADAEDAQDLLAPGTAIVQAGSTNGTTMETFRVPFADLATQQVGFFLDDTPGHGPGRFDNQSVVLVVQSMLTVNSSGTGNIVTPSNFPRGAVVSLITVAETFDRNNHSEGSVIESIALRGDGGSIQTQQTIGLGNGDSQTLTPFSPIITSTGTLGDVIVGGDLPSVTAASIFGSILPGGGIPATSTIQTTGLRTDPITGAISQVPADLGSVYVVTCPPNDSDHPQPPLPSDATPYVTTTVVEAHGPGGLAGQIICGGDLISKVISDGPTSGTILVQPVAWEPGAGNLGTTFTYPSGQVVSLGGFVSSGPMIAPSVNVPDQPGPGNTPTTTTQIGLLQSGTITVAGLVYGNIDINGPMNGPTITAGNNTLIINGTVQGGYIQIGGSLDASITIDGPMNGPTITADNNTLNINGTVQGGFIQIGGSLEGSITIGGPMNGPTIASRGHNTTVDLASTGNVQGGLIATAGAVLGTICVNGPMNGPDVEVGGDGLSMVLNGALQGGEISLGSSSASASITVGGPMSGPTIDGDPRSNLAIGGLVQGGQIITTGDSLGSITVHGPVTPPSLPSNPPGVATTVKVAPRGGAVLAGGKLGNLTIGGPFGGEVVAIGNIVGAVNIDGPVRGGVIATSGAIDGNLTIGGPLSGQVVSVGNINGDVTIRGGLQGGRIATLGSIGNLTIGGSIDNGSAVVAEGSIGNLSVGDVRGIVAAVGTITASKVDDTRDALLYASQDTADAAVIDEIFTQGVSPLSSTDLFDQASSLDLQELLIILQNLNALTVKTGGGLRI